MTEERGGETERGERFFFFFFKCPSTELGFSFFYCRPYKKFNPDSFDNDV